MDQEQAIAKARQFADMAHSVEIDKLSRQAQENLAALYHRLSAKGSVLSGNAVVEAANVHSGQLTAMLDSRLNLLLEGFELHQVAIDDNVRDGVVAELAALRAAWIANANEAMKSDHVLRSGPVPQHLYLQLLEHNVGLPSNEVRTQVDRARHARKKAESNMTVY